MKRKNGFIATSVMYSFFAIFAMLALIILATYTHYRTLIDNINKNVLTDLNANIAKKYTSIYNLIDNGDFESNTNWVYNNAIRSQKDTAYGSAFDGSYSGRLAKVNASINETFSIKNKVNVDNKIHKLYVSFRIFRNGPITGTGSITLNVSGVDYTITGSALTGEFSNWTKYSEIIGVYVTNDTDWKMTFKITENNNNNYVFVDDVLVSDITSVYNGTTTTNTDMSSNLDTYLDYFNGKTSIATYGTKTDATLTNNLLQDNLAYSGGIDYIKHQDIPKITLFNTATTEGMYFKNDDYGSTYFYSGTVTNNNVIFGGYCWQVLRINGNNTTRMIYNGVPTNGQCVADHDNNYISQSKFNERSDDNAYVGYMYGTAGSTTYEATHTNTNSSAVKKVIDEWYSKYLISNASKISDTEFCGDREIGTKDDFKIHHMDTGIYETYTNSKLGYGMNVTFYKALDESYKNEFTFFCTNQNDRYTVTDTVTGNSALTYPIALATYDEIFAYHQPPTINLSSDIVTVYWTMTPADVLPFSNPYNKQKVSAFEYANDYNDLYSVWVTGAQSVRPVINLNGNLNYTKGNGMRTTPYVVE